MIYSFSQIQTFLICPRRYQFQYLEKIPRKDPSYKLCLWNCVHESLQWWYQQIFPWETLFPSRIPSEMELLSFFCQKWERSVKIWKILQKNEDEIALWLERGKRYLSQYRHRYAKSDFSSFITVEEEKEFIFQFSQGQKCKVKIDRVDFLKNGEIRIVDYKTGEYLSSQVYWEYQEQLLLYVYALRTLYPMSPIISSLCFLHFDREEFFCFSDEKIQIFVEKYEKILNTIETFRNSYFEKNILFPWPDNDIVCGKCDYQDICPFYKISKNNSLVSF